MTGDKSQLLNSGGLAAVDRSPAAEMLTSQRNLGPLLRRSVSVIVLALFSGLSFPSVADTLFVSAPLPDVQTIVERSVFARFGMPGLFALVFLYVVVRLLLNWETFRLSPLGRAARHLVPPRRLPKAPPDQFTVAVVRLEHDRDHTYERLIVEALSECPWVHVDCYDRSIKASGVTPRQEVQKGHDRARSYLRTSRAHILIWGTVLTSGGEAVPKLYMTTTEADRGAREPKRYPVTSGDLQMPEIFWSELVDVLRLVVTSAAAELNPPGQFVADRLVPFIARVRPLVLVSEAAHGWTPRARATLIFILANSLLTLGEQEGTNGPLDEAILHYREVLTYWTRDRVPVDWAVTQNNLGTALWALGERESGAACLEEAVTAYRAALEETKRDRVPLNWATMQNNLGVALWTLGERESGIAHLEEAVAAFRAALEERTRDHVPLDWAMTQNNLGTALGILGERESGTASLEEAADAFRAVLEEYTRDHVPLDWARAQNNLGTALRTLGERELGTTRLEEAVVAYRASLEERTRDRVPLDWATTQNNLGAALRALGERESGTARLEEAVAACRAALEERARDRVPLNWATTQSNLGTALATLGRRESGTTRLEEAVAAYRAALEEFTRDRVPLEWAATQNNLGNALRTLGELTSGTSYLEEAIAAFRTALNERTRVRVPLKWAATQNNLGAALHSLAERKGSPAILCEALRCHLEALVVCTGPAPHDASIVAANLRGDLDLLARNFPPADRDACLEKHTELLARFREVISPTDASEG